MARFVNPLETCETYNSAVKQSRIGRHQRRQQQARAKRRAELVGLAKRIFPRAVGN